ncbi:MAG: Rdx family protein [Candidatus Promineifilaceae bacterium]|nr:Rdx family protein [Candidatus Promineifilaceae bacterium]
MQRAVRVTDELLSNYQHIIDDLTLITGTKGAFEVRVNDELIFSKQTMQKRHAEPGEILAMFRKLVGPEVPIYPQTK